MKRYEYMLLNMSSLDPENLNLAGLEGWILLHVEGSRPFYRCYFYREKREESE